MSRELFALSVVVDDRNGGWWNQLHLVEAVSADHAEAHVFAEAVERGRKVLNCVHLSVTGFMSTVAAA